MNQSVITLKPVDWFIIIFYFVFIIAIGFYAKKFTKTGDDYFLAGRRNSSLIAGLAFLSANLGSLEILGWTGATLKYGILVSHWYWIGAIPAMLFLALFMMPFYYHSKIKSIPGYLKHRFDERTRVLSAISFLFMTVLMSGINMYLMALVFRSVLGWDWHLSMWVSAITIAIYVTLGGLISAIFTEVVQFFLIWFGLFLIPFLGLIDLGGFSAITANLDKAFLSLWSTTLDPADNPMGIHWLGMVLGLGWVLSFGYWTADFLVVQRAFSAKDLNAARMTPIIASFFKMALPFIIVVSGFVALSLVKTGELNLLVDNGNINYDSALPVLMTRYFPSGLLGLGVTALLAGFMAGQAGNISAFNTVWTYDLYVLLRKGKVSDVSLLWMGRITTIVGVLLSVAIAYWVRQFPTIMDFIQAIFSWVNAPLFATLLLGMFWRKTSPAGAFWGLLCGMLTSFFLFLGMRSGVLDSVLHLITLSDDPSNMSKNLWQAWWGWFICLIVTIIITLFTKPKPENELVGLVKGLASEGEEKLARPPLYKNPYLWAGISFVVFVFLNIYFW
ncbi:MAG: sodium/solute symporter [Deferribacterota bacterium]|nr:sodium/solute symporter [Deferribacterota bacterium]